MNGKRKCRFLKKLRSRTTEKNEISYEVTEAGLRQASKVLAVSAIAVTLLISASGCVPEDIMPPLNGDIPFEQSQNTADDMEDMEKPFTEPDENAFYTEGAVEDPTE